MNGIPESGLTDGQFVRTWRDGGHNVLAFGAGQGGSCELLLGVIQNARSQGVDVEAHIYPYTAGQNAGLRNIIPPWAHEGGNTRMLERLKDPSLRARLERDITQGIPGWYNHYTAVGSDWSRIQIVSVASPPIGSKITSAPRSEVSSMTASNRSSL